MARPLFSEDRFTSRELAIAAALSPRNIALLTERGLAPRPVGGTEGRGGHRSYDSAGLAAVALLGAFHLAGMELLVAGRLAATMAEEYGLTHGRLPSNLQSYLRKPNSPHSGRAPWNMTLPMVDIDDDYWLHERLRFHSNVYQVGVALRGDFIVDIADQHFVLTRFHDMVLWIASPVSDPLPVSPDYRIVGQGPSARIISIHEGLDSLDFSVDRASAEALRAREAEYLHAYNNAVTRLTINVSLAVRNGLDRVADGRAARADVA